jgi:hypothetical protein
MASGLADFFVTVPAEQARELGRRGLEAVSRHDDLILYHMKPDESWFVLLFKMAVDRVSHHLAQLFERLALSEDGVSQCPSCVPPLGGVFYGKDNFLIRHVGQLHLSGFNVRIHQNSPTELFVGKSREPRFVTCDFGNSNPTFQSTELVASPPSVQQHMTPVVRTFSASTVQARPRLRTI